MTQASSNTIIYEQIMSKILSFIERYNNKEIYTKQDMVNEFNQIVSEINNNTNQPLVSIEQFIKGEPPSSEKLNRFLSNMRNDIEIVSRQMDYLTAKAISSFNLFSQEIQSEKFHTERIVSKSKILQMYSSSPSKDIVYLGDSFENMDLVDFGRISTRNLPLINDGAFTLPIESSRPWQASRVLIIDSNGFFGNNHQAVKSLSENQEEYYAFKFESSRYSSDLRSLVDNNASTFFEIEKVTVDTSDIGNGIPLPDEFCYFVESSSLRDGQGSSGQEKITWNNTLDLPLKFKVSLRNNTPSQANCVRVYPFFENALSVKVSEILVFDRENTAINVLSSPIYIGASPLTYSYEEFSNYYHNSATVYFDEMLTSRIDIVFEQESFEDIIAKHMYWKPDYKGENLDGSPFFGLDRFNPGIISGEVVYNKNTLIPNLRSALVEKTFKTTISLPVTITPIVDKSQKYYIKLIAEKDGEKKDFFFSSLSLQDDYDESWLGFDIQDFNSGPDSLINFYINTENAESQLEFIVNKFNEIFQNEWLIGPSGSEFTVDKDSLKIESFSNFTENSPTRINVPLSNDFEIRQAKRRSIALKSVEVSHEKYANEAEIVSRVFQYDRPVETLMLSLNYKNNKEFVGSSNISAFVSLGETDQWISISPIEFSFLGVPEVLSLNQNITSNYRIAGVSYLNYPAIPEKVKDIRVRLRIAKDPNINYTPQIYSYLLMAKVGV
jgi:hypothetical protein